MRVLSVALLLALGLACLASSVAASANPPAIQEWPAELMVAGTYPAEADFQQGLILDEPNDAFNATTLGKSWTSYKQCDSRWGKNRLGTSRNTICSAGCAMTSVTMALATHGAKISGKTITPASMNSWLTSHGGYVSGDLLVWSAVNNLGSIKYRAYYRGYGSMSASKLASAAKAGQAIVVNVRKGSHWVLVTGPPSGSNFPVHDPGFSVSHYSYGEMGNFVVYY